MENNKLGHEPAYPVSMNVIAENYQGMSKRFYAACAAMQGIVSAVNNDVLYEYDCEHIVKESFRFADELLKQENE